MMYESVKKVRTIWRLFLYKRKKKDKKQQYIYRVSRAFVY